MMDSPNCEPSDRLGRLVLLELARQLPSQAFSTEVGKTLTVTIRAIHPAVGDVTIWTENNEVTVDVGELYHCHFDPYCYQRADKLPEAQEEAALRAVRFVADFLKDRITIGVRRSGGAPIGAWARHAAEPTQPPDLLLPGEFLSPTSSNDPETGTARYRWSGPVSE